MHLDSSQNGAQPRVLCISARKTQKETQKQGANLAAYQKPTKLNRHEQASQMTLCDRKNLLSCTWTLQK
jgi:hypothetical protein